MPSLNYSIVEKKLGIRCKKRKLLKLAFTHSSYLQTAKDKSKEQSNETLEFLGDAVLELVTREYLLKKLPKAHEGELSELKKRYTSTEALYRTGKKLGLGKLVLMNRGEELTGGRDRPSIIAGCLEALIGALYLDHGLHYAEKFINRILFEKRTVKRKDYKSLLNSLAMRNRSVIFYKVAKEEGPPHRKMFYVDLYMNKKKVGQGSGKTKKKAEQEAAKEFLRKECQIKNAK